MSEMLGVKGLNLGMVIRSDEDLTFCKQMGIEYVDAAPLLRLNSIELGLESEGYWSAEAPMRLREYVESFGLKLAGMSLPALSIPEPTFTVMGQRGVNVVLRPSPQRDRNIERVCQCIEALGKAGVPSLFYWLSFLSSVERSPGWSAGRGGIRCSHFDYDEMKNAPPYPTVGSISADKAWEGIEYFIKRVIPVAEEYKVKMALHPDDVPVPPGTAFRGVVSVLNSVEGLKRFVDLHPSPYHGLCFGQGCIAEFSTKPEEVYEAIRYFGSRKKIFWVHFRNIRGGLLKFEETFPDEGDIDMLKAMRIYKEVGYDGVLIPDHVPQLDFDSPQGHRAFAFALGYMKALIQAIESES